MMAPEPLRSTMSTVNVEETSLAVPSDDKLRSGQQRVLDQVHTIKRGKSKYGKNGSASPIGQSSQTTHEFGSFKFSPTKANGTFGRSSSTMSAGFSKMLNTQRSRSVSSKVMGSRHYNTWEQQISTTAWPKSPNGLKPSRSDPALTQPLSPAAAPVMRAQGRNVQSQQTLQTRTNRHSTYSMTNGNVMTNSQTRIRPTSALSHTDGKMGTIKASKLEQKSAVNSAVNMSDITLKEAVEFLSRPEENYQQCGATFIQHATYKEEGAKQQVYQLGGIPFLVTLLRSPNPGVSLAAASALRNLVFKDQDNKIEVQHCGGIAKALQLLKETDSTDTQKQTTGLLWNLSSADELKQELIATALPALTENVVVPFTCWSDSSANNNIHPDVFYNATGCLRNLSWAQKKERREMRECRGLIDSLMSYVQSCVAEDNPDDKSVENCACILHNLTYQLETESPQCFSKYYPSPDSQPENKKSPVIGCFSPKSSKAQNKFSFDMARGLPEDSNPSGEKWLCHPKAMQTYLSLLGSSQKDATLEACCGALQNLTANGGPGSSAMSQILVQKLMALPHVASLLKSPNRSLQKNAMSLLGNMSRSSGSSGLQTSIAKQILPDLTSLLSAGPRELGNSDDAIATACSTARNLLAADPEFSKKVLSNDFVLSLADLSENGSLPKGSKAAAQLLYSIWNEKNLQGVVKKLGIGKSLFVNDNTTAAHRLLQVIE